MIHGRCAHLHCAGGGNSFFVAIEGEDKLSNDRQVQWTRRFDRRVRTRLAAAMHAAIEEARSHGAQRFTIDPELDHELMVQNLGFDPSTQTLIAF